MNTCKLDYLVGERVMSYTVQDVGVNGHPVYRLIDSNGNRVSDNWQFHASGVKTDAWNVCPRFSSDIAAAWMLAERVLSDGNDIEIEAQVKPDGKVLWSVVIDPMLHRGGAIENICQLAICVAALRAVGTAEEEIRGAMGETG